METDVQFAQDEEKMNKKAIEAYGILNAILGDLVVGTRTIDHLYYPLLYLPRDESYKIAITRLCVFHIIITLNKYIEFYKHYNRVIPDDIRNSCKDLMKILEEKQIQKFRNKVVGHIWDDDTNAPITNREHDTYMQKIYGETFDSFLLWINNPNNNVFPNTVVSIVETAKKRIAEEYNINDYEVFKN
jgi:hypothetical protein